MLIDSHEASRQALGARLAAEGFTVTLASDHPRQLASAASGCEAVLLGPNCSSDSGLGVYQTLRMDPATRHLPIIVLMEEVPAAYWQPLPYDADGETIFMGSPANPTDLFARLHDVLIKASAPRSSAETRSFG